MIAVVTGMIATFPVGGVAWDYGQYLIELERLGFEVYYLEDIGWLTYDPIKGEYTEDPCYGIGFLKKTLFELSPTLKDRWHFRAMDGRSFGIESRRMAEIIKNADLFLNISGGTVLRDEYMSNPCKVFIDTDPGWNHFVKLPEWDNKPATQEMHGWRAHDFFFTYAENIGYAGCILPTLEVKWIPTRPPVVLNCWNPLPPGKKWTTVMTWKDFKSSITYKGKQYGTKELEFNKIALLPQLTDAEFEIAIGGSGPPKEKCQQIGWTILDSVEQSKTLESYRHYIQQSKGELSVAKNVYVATYSGWFSCRSVCYMASSRPVVIQDTGFSRFIPTGEGILAFNNQEEAQAAIEEVEKNYAKHQQAALNLAHDYFDSTLVIGRMLKEIGLK